MSVSGWQTHSTASGWVDSPLTVMWRQTGMFCFGILAANLFVLLVACQTLTKLWHQWRLSLFLVPSPFLHSKLSILCSFPPTRCSYCHLERPTWLWTWKGSRKSKSKPHRNCGLIQILSADKEYLQRSGGDKCWDNPLTWSTHASV